MIAVKEDRQTLEQRVAALLSEYQALEVEQVVRYFGFPAKTMAKVFKSLEKKGRITVDHTAEIIKVVGDISVDKKLLHSFWILLDCLEECEFHGIGQFPLILEMYRKGSVYGILYCAAGDELMILRSVTQMQEKVGFQPILLLEDACRADLLSGIDAVFCKVSEDGEVEYFTYEL